MYRQFGNLMNSFIQKPSGVALALLGVHPAINFIIGASTMKLVLTAAKHKPSRGKKTYQRRA